MLDIKPVHYCNNKELLSWLVAFKEVEYKSKEWHRLREEISLSIQTIIIRFSFSRNYINYTYRDEMIADGVIACIRAIEKFNAEKSSNPFGYFTQIASNAFKARITKEKEQSYIKQRVITSYSDAIDFDSSESEDIMESQLQLLESYGIVGNDGFDYFRRKEQEAEDKKAERKKELSGFDALFDEEDKKELQ